MQAVSLRVLVIPATLVTLLVSFVGVIGIMGPTEESARQLIRLSATSSLLLFALAWSASSLNRYFPVHWRGIMKARRRIGVSFAISHTFHLGAIAWLVELAYNGDWSELDLVGGAVIYTFIYLMAFTSNDAAVRLLGPRFWRWLHKIGGYLIWIAFTQSYISNTFQRDGLHYPLLAGLCAGLLALRIAAFRKKHSTTG
jgi:DMSO/TMAO reductase YedYZ heme-binding membrane subunit